MLYWIRSSGFARLPPGFSILCTVDFTGFPSTIPCAIVATQNSTSFSFWLSICQLFAAVKLFLTIEGVHMFPKEIFSKRLYNLRKSRNIIAKDVAEALGLSKAAISQFETGKSQPSAAVLIALADYFNVSLDYLVGRSDTPYILKARDVTLLSPDELALLKKLREVRGEIPDWFSIDCAWRKYNAMPAHTHCYSSGLLKKIPERPEASYI